MMHKVPPNGATLHRVRVCHLKMCKNIYLKKKKKPNEVFTIYPIGEDMKLVWKKNIYPPNKDINIHAKISFEYI
jgi:hypothetical protein